MRRETALLRWALIAPLSAAYLWLAYRTTASAQPSTLGAALAVLPVGLFALVLAWKSQRRTVAMALWAAGAAVLILAWPILERRFAWVYFIQHAGIFSLLAIAFGRTLATGAEPLITRLARLVHGDRLAPEILRYSRSITLLWTLFFGLVAATSAVLFALGDLARWSLFADLLTPVLIAATFAAEILTRLLVLPAEVRPGLVESIRAGLLATRGSAP